MSQVNYFNSMKIKYLGSKLCDTKIMFKSMLELPL